MLQTTASSLQCCKDETEWEYHGCNFCYENVNWHRSVKCFKYGLLVAEASEIIINSKFSTVFGPVNVDLK